MGEPYPHYDADKLAIALSPKGNSPAEVYEREYWLAPPEVCLLDEIVALKNGDVKIVCDINVKNGDWIGDIAHKHGFAMKAEIVKNKHGKYMKFTVRKV